MVLNFCYTIFGLLALSLTGNESAPWWLLLYGYLALSTIGHKLITYLSSLLGFSVEPATSFTALTCSKTWSPCVNRSLCTGAGEGLTENPLGLVCSQARFCQFSCHSYFLRIDMCICWQFTTGYTLGFRVCTVAIFYFNKW
jgi:hypothetical protein